MTSSSTPNYFAALNAINVSEHLEKKGNFSYLSWPYAVAQLRLADPTACWTVQRFNGLPYLATDAGFFVEVAVTVQGVTLSQIHPVLDARNRPIIAPTSFDINTSIQRCLVKAIALHGLGLYVFAGEDLPQALPESGAANDDSGRQDLPREVDTTITAAQQLRIHKLVLETGTQLDRMLAYFGARNLKEIKASDFLRVVRSLEQRRAAA